MDEIYVSNDMTEELKKQESRRSVINFVSFLTEEYNLKGIDVWKLTDDEEDKK